MNARNTEESEKSEKSKMRKKCSFSVLAYLSKRYNYDAVVDGFT